MRLSRSLALVPILAACATGRPSADPAPAAARPAGSTAELPLKHAAQPTGPAITAGDLMTRLYVFADDSMLGREAGTAGNVKGTEYIAAEARRIGLEPAGENGTYFQDVPLTVRALSAKSSLLAGGKPIALGADVLPIPPVGGLPFASQRAFDGLQVVYGGRLSDPSSAITPQQAAGKLVVLAAPLGPDGRPDFAFWKYPALVRFFGASAIAIATLEQTPAEITGIFRQPAMELGSGATTAAGQPPRPAAMLVSASGAEQLLGAPLSGLKPGAAGRAVSGAFDFALAPSPAPARNVVAVLRGSDPALRNQYVAIGAHNDHVGVQDHDVDHDSLRAFNRVVRPMGADSPTRPATADETARVRALLDSLRAKHGGARADSIANGADDDGSGSVSVLEIAQSLATMPVKPKRSILFVWHTGEEKGLYGSTWYTDHPTVPRDSIVAQLNIDMIGRGSATDLPAGGPGFLQLIGSRRLSTELGDLVESTNARSNAGFNFDYSYDADGHPENYYCRSDHYMYARYGIPIVFFSTGGHVDYHQVTDEPQYIDYPHMARVATLVRDIAVNVANLDHRVVVDKPKPDPNGTCKQ
ncbi:MAG: M28 family peptidase [Gemmatimonadaceae bacterium]